ncbi:hypothetical protein [Desulfogranum japonicum]|uniref:hypothetical protein n=1 Tax=Desulfogranum japonicum TaxID=231447 RepID=UPI00048DC736|nr:hypothetical protein [Desulfogranum japonicum]
MNNSNIAIMQTCAVHDYTNLLSCNLFSSIFFDPAFHAQGGCSNGQRFFPSCDWASVQSLRVDYLFHLSLPVEMKNKTNLIEHDELCQAIQEKGGG